MSQNLLKGGRAADPMNSPFHGPIDQFELNSCLRALTYRKQTSNVQCGNGRSCSVEQVITKCLFDFTLGFYGEPSWWSAIQP